MNKSESKYFNTAVRMDEAFLSLLEQKDCAYITVKEICEKAGVNRSTFYLHYETIGDLLAESVEYIHRDFLSRFSGTEDLARNLHSCREEELFLLTPAYLRPYLSFVRQHRQLYRTVMDNPAVLSADKTYQRLFECIFNPILDRLAVPPTDRHYLMLFYLKGLTAIVGEWLKGDCADSMDHVIGIMQRCVLPPASYKEKS